MTSFLDKMQTRRLSENGNDSIINKARHLLPTLIRGSHSHMHIRKKSKELKALRKIKKSKDMEFFLMGDKSQLHTHRPRAQSKPIMIVEESEYIEDSPKCYRIKKEKTDIRAQIEIKEMNEIIKKNVHARRTIDICKSVIRNCSPAKQRYERDYFFSTLPKIIPSSPTKLIETTPAILNPIEDIGLLSPWSQGSEKTQL